MLWYVCWVMRWSVYAAQEKKQLDECQLYVEGTGKSLWFSRRRDDLAMLRWKGNSWTSGNCTLRDGKEPMVF
jgi:hypothetical protein